MCETKDISILYCYSEEKSARTLQKMCNRIGFKRFFMAKTAKQANLICANHRIDIILQSTEFAGAGGFKHGKFLIKQNPDSFLLFMSSKDHSINGINVLEAKEAGGVAFIKNNDQAELVTKLSMWIDVAKHIRNVKEFINGETYRPRQIYA